MLGKIAHEPSRIKKLTERHQKKRWIDPGPSIASNMSMKFARFAGLCVGLAIVTNPCWAQTADKPAQPPTDNPSGAGTPAPERSSPTEPQEISHEEMVKEQERRDREAEEERDRDDQ